MLGRLHIRYTRGLLYNPAGLIMSGERGPELKAPRWTRELWSSSGPARTRRLNRLSPGILIAFHNRPLWILTFLQKQQSRCWCSFSFDKSGLSMGVPAIQRSGVFPIKGLSCKQTTGMSASKVSTCQPLCVAESLPSFSAIDRTNQQLRQAGSF